jgi:uncharacterized membrane protein YraQ (UPF0718 family)
MKERIKLLLIIGIFLAIYLIPVEIPGVPLAILEAFHLLKEYAREHVLFCLIPAFFIAGAISIFINQSAILKYLGENAKKILSYSVASISGGILAVCSCTVLPLFAGIYKRGAGIGPATTFLYSGPAINILAIILTARILGPELGIARAIGAILFSIIIGLIMSLLFLREESNQDTKTIIQADNEDALRPFWQTGLYFLTLILILIFAAWGKPKETAGFLSAIHQIHWPITIGLLILLTMELLRWFRKSELIEWSLSTWDFAKQILPLLFIGVFVAGLLMGRPGSQAGLIPYKWIQTSVGNNSIWANLLASVIGAFMYFATLTEVPILQGLLGAGMEKGPALALLLAGPALSLPNMLVIRSVIGIKKTLTYIVLVVLCSSLAGILFGWIINT